MEGLKRYDIVRYGDHYAVVVESDLLAPDDIVVAIPLLADYPGVSGLNPIIEHDGRPLVLATRLIAAVQRRHFKKVGSAIQHDVAIMRALDVLFTGL